MRAIPESRLRMIELLHESKKDITCGVSSAISYCLDDEIFKEDFSGWGTRILKDQDKGSKKISF